jgi:hypothetical protein
MQRFEIFKILIAYKKSEVFIVVKDLAYNIVQSGTSGSEEHTPSILEDRRRPVLKKGAICCSEMLVLTYQVP